MSEPDVANTSTLDVKDEFLERTRVHLQSSNTNSTPSQFQSNIGTHDELIQTEALLSNLETEVQVIYSYDAQIELLFEDDAELDRH